MSTAMDVDVSRCEYGEQTVYAHGIITSKNDDGMYRVNWEDGAERAFSCVVEPEIGDHVVYCEAAKKRYILSILQRTVQSAMNLNGPENNEMILSSKRLSVISQTAVDIAARDEIALTSYAGTIMMTAQNLAESIADTVVRTVRNLIVKAVQISADAEQVCRVHGCHQIITADKDIRIDGERINMG